MLTVKDFRIGDRVQVHPATSLWIRGDRFGEVKLVGRKLLTLKMDRSGKKVPVLPDNVLEKVEG